MNLDITYTILIISVIILVVRLVKGMITGRTKLTKTKVEEIVAKTEELLNKDVGLVGSVVGLVEIQAKKHLMTVGRKMTSEEKLDLAVRMISESLGSGRINKARVAKSIEEFLRSPEMMNVK